MLHPAPTSKLPPTIARGTIKALHPATATKPPHLVLALHNSDYELHLLPIGPAPFQPGERAVGRIRADAKRVDVVNSGGRYVEPVIGRPRRVQGTIVATDPDSNSITVNAGVPITCRLCDPNQRAAQFQPGQFVSFDVLRGSTFEPAQTPTQTPTQTPGQTPGH